MISVDLATLDRLVVVGASRSIRRGQAEGVFDDQLTTEWIQQVLWGVSYTAFEQVTLGALAKFDVAATVARTLERGIVAQSGEPT